MTVCDLDAFNDGTLDVAAFGHRQHLQAGFELLRRDDFARASDSYCRALRCLTSNAGHPEKFHMTVTIAMLSAIAEREPEKASCFAQFIGAHPELGERDFLARHNSSARLGSKLARATFVLPDRAA